MPAFILKTEDTATISVDVNNKKRSIYYIVEASSPIKVYLMDEKGLDNYKNSISIDSYIEPYSKKYHEEKICLPFGRRWYLVIPNLTKGNCYKL